MGIDLESLKQELEFRRCANDCEYFLRNYWYIRHPEQGKIVFDLRPAQSETLHAWLTERYSIVLKARQIGFSTLAAGMAFWEVFFHSDRFIIMLSKTERESVKLLEKSKYGYKYLPKWMKERGPKLTNDHSQKMPFDNDSGIESLPSNNDPARGEAVYRVIVDEWAFLPNPEEAWASIEPITDVGGRVIGLSTANGSGNFFHEFWIKATTGTSRFKPIFYPFSANTDRDESWYAVKKQNMQEWQLHQEYPRSADEAFIKSGNPVFDIDALMQMPVEPADARGYLDEIGKDRPPNLLVNPDGPLQVWALPERGIRYVIGADVAEGLEHGDFSVAHVLDTQTGLVVAKWRGHIDPDLFGSDVLYNLGNFFNNALVGVEANNHGLTTLVALNLRGYGNIYRRHSYDERTPQRARKMGWMTTAKTKPMAIDELAKLLRGPDPDIILLDQETVAELKTYVRDADGKTHGSPYDDQVMSLAVAGQMLKHYSTPQIMETVNDEFTFDWWVRQANGEKKATNIGAFNLR